MPDSRQKGKRYERYIRRIYSKLYPDCRRGYQSRAGDDEADVTGTGEYWIECKHYHKGGLTFRAMRQAMDACDMETQAPVVHVHEDNGEHLVVLRLEHWMDTLERLEDLVGQR